jgi:putative transcriptional regulator
MMMEGMSDAIAYAQVDETRGRVATPLDVRAIRKATKKSQTAFAEAYHLPVRTVQEWE